MRNDARTRRLVRRLTIACFALATLAIGCAVVAVLAVVA